jgi:hypothetical protein
MQIKRTLQSFLTLGTALFVWFTINGAGSLLAAQGVAITSNTATSGNLFVQWNAADPERVEVIKWNPGGLTGTEPNLTNTGTTGTAPCFSGDVEYFGNSWAPPDPPNGKVLVGAGTSGLREPGPDSKVMISSNSNGCEPTSAGVPVNTTYKFWQGGQAINKMRVTRKFTFESAFTDAFRPLIPRFFPITGFNQVLHPNADGTSLLTKDPFLCPVGCTVTDWNGNNEELSWFAIHNPTSGQGIVVRRSPSATSAALWIDWDGASFTTATSVLLQPPAGGFFGEITEAETLCFYDVTTWIPSLKLPRAC